MGSLALEEVVQVLTFHVNKVLGLPGALHTSGEVEWVGGRPIQTKRFYLQSIPGLQVNGYPFATGIEMRGYVMDDTTRPDAYMVFCNSRWERLFRISGTSQSSMLAKLKGVLVEGNTPLSWPEVVERVVRLVENTPADSGETKGAVTRELLLSLAKEILQILKRK